MTDDIKSLWNGVEVTPKPDKEILLMLEEKHHPVLKSIRKQVRIEAIGWVLFLTCYYSMFDGADKPWFINLVLVVCVLSPLIQSIFTYRLTNSSIDGENIADSLSKHLQRTKVHSKLAVLTRFLFSTGLLTFFSYSISFDGTKQLLLFTVIILIAIQLFILNLMWRKRIDKLQMAINGLYES